MARNRNIYQNENLAVSLNATSTGSGSHAYLRRIQNFGSSHESTKEDINQFGNLARIGALVVTSPNVSADFSYYLSDGYNERALGFYVQDSDGFTAESSFASGHMIASSGVNLFEIIAPEGYDANQETSLSGKWVKGFGNTYVSNYSLSAAVGQFPTVSVSVEALNTNSQQYVYQGALTGLNTPAVNAENGTSLTQNTGVRLPLPTDGTGASIPLVLQPKDFSISFGNFTGTSSTKNSSFHSLEGADGLSIQSVDISIPLSRTPIERLGSRFAYARPVDFPITVSLSVSAIANEMVARNLASMLDDTAEGDITVTINQPDGSAGVAYTLKGCTFDSENSSLDIGGNKTVDLTFTSQVGGINQTNRGLFMSGVNTDAVFA